MRETLLNAILNNLRYPNLITFYFINLIFGFFSTDNEILQEQIFRYLFLPNSAIITFSHRMLESRASLDPPLPWGIVYTYVNILRLPKMKEKANSLNSNIRDVWGQGRPENFSDG